MLGCNLIEHHGIIDLGDGEIEAAISFEDSRLRLTSAGDEIGDWDRTMYQVTRSDKATFILSAEGYDLPFKPLHPDEFAAAAMNGLAGTTRPISHRKRRIRPGADGTEQAPPAKPITLVLFYLLAAGTVAMGAWALVTIIG